MTIEIIKEVLMRGDKYGSALKQMLDDLAICNLSEVSDQQAKGWIEDYDNRNNPKDQEV